MELTYQVQTYEWGKLGLDSKVATLYKIANPSVEIKDDTPYAELWMGTHVNGPSTLKTTGELLSSVIKSHPEILGESIRLLFGDELPFLFKVLSVNKALSIQAHPSIEHAKELHLQRPDLYKDPNHKPELAIALTPFEALCGFRPIEEIQKFMQDIRELRAIVGTDAAEKFITSKSNTKDLLKVCFRNMMTCPPDVVVIQLKQLLYKFSCADRETRITQLSSLVERLHSQFPGDIGCFAVYFLNCVTLNLYEALYLGPNEPHAYLSGDCIECMACSDNVVRAGLTPKFKDVETLCEMLTYESRPVEAQIFKPIIEDPYSAVFSPPVPDFAVVKMEVPANEKEYLVKIRRCASLLLVIQGSGKIGNVQLKPGVVLCIAALEKVTIVNITQNMLLFQAMANVFIIDT